MGDRAITAEYLLNGTNSLVLDSLQDRVFALSGAVYGNLISSIRAKLGRRVVYTVFGPVIFCITAHQVACVNLLYKTQANLFWHNT